MSRPLALRVTEEAEADLAEIWAYVASEGSETAAARILAKTEAASRRLLDYPLSGPSREQFAAGLRVTLASGYAIYYSVSQTELILVRVLHGARDAAAIAERGGFS